MTLSDQHLLCVIIGLLIGIYIVLLSIREKMK